MKTQNWSTDSSLPLSTLSSAVMDLPTAAHTLGELRVYTARPPGPLLCKLRHFVSDYGDSDTARHAAREGDAFFTFTHDAKGLVGLVFSRYVSWFFIFNPSFFILLTRFAAPHSTSCSNGIPALDTLRRQRGCVSPLFGTRIVKSTTTMRARSRQNYLHHHPPRHRPQSWPLDTAAMMGI